MKTYVGWVNANGGYIAKVEIDGRACELARRLDLANHSPTGFCWGYNGSGPAQLAIAILADVLGAPRAHKYRENWVDDELDARTIAVRLHQRFKQEFIAGLARIGRWTITEQAVLEFIARMSKESDI